MRENTQQRIDSVLTQNMLTKEELALTTAVTNWQRPEQWGKFLYEAHGRSLVFRSPSRISDKTTTDTFSGLQIIGAGGSASALRSGITERVDRVNIRRVSDTDCSDVFPELFQLREIDQHGKLQLTQRSYAPLGGMDKTEAVQRKRYTSALSTVTKNAALHGYVAPFVVPEFAAEGVYVAKKDPTGNRLRYQVYRVPVIDRFPNQVARTVQKKGVDVALQTIGTAANLLGESLRIFHEVGLAYMDGHAGNMSLLKTPKQNVLYVTDLGSIKQFTSHPYPDRYRGFDLYMYLESMGQLYTQLTSLTRTLNIPTINFDSNFYLTTAGSYLSGYFQPELLKNTTSEHQARTTVMNMARETLEAYLGTHRSPQQFIEFFESFYTKQKTK